MFLAGAVFAVGYGVYQLSSNPASGGYLVAYLALAVAVLAEGSSLLRAVHQTRAEAREAQLPLLRYFRESRDPNVKMVLFEDTAAVMGIGLAFAGILADQLSGSVVFDPLASIAIGLLLVTVAAVMAHDTSELLVGAAARPAERAALEAALGEFDQVDRVLEVLTMVLGPNSLLVAARVEFGEGNDDDIEQVSDAIETRLRGVVPDVTEVFLDATTARAKRRRPQEQARATQSPQLNPPGYDG
jgi:divalent metal cation (Fe/Co/Zn/Cd) transporter